MFKPLIVIVSIFAVILAGCGANPTPAPPALFISREEIDDDRSFINVNIDEVKILKKTGDLVGQGEFRLLIIGSDTQGRSSGTYCPGDKPIKIQVGSTVKSPCLFVLGFDEQMVSEGVFLMVIAIDEDESSLSTDLSYELIANQMGDALGKMVAKGILGTASKSNPYSIATQVLVSFLGGKVKNWLEEAEIIGSQGIYLSRNDDWSAGERTIATSNDEGLRIVYSVIRSSSNPGPEIVVITQKPQNPPTVEVKQPTPPPATKKASSPVTGSATISCANRLYFVMLRRSPGYNNKNEATDKVAEVPCGETVLILGESTRKDGLNWYPVSWNGLEGWMADYTSSGKKILIFD